jgi:hypothetical protein
LRRQRTSILADARTAETGGGRSGTIVVPTPRRRGTTVQRHDTDPQPDATTSRTGGHRPDTTGDVAAFGESGTPDDAGTAGLAAGSAEIGQLLDELGGLHHLAVRAEQLARAVGIHGATALDPHARSSLEQARSNARAIVASLDRAI